MKKAKMLVAIVLCMSLVLTLCACGGKLNRNGEYTLNEYLNSGETIWFHLKELDGKDSDVLGVYVFESDGTMYFQNSVQHTLGELEQMEDADIVAMVQAGYKEYVAGYDYRRFVSQNEEESRAEIKDALFSTIAYINQYYALDKEIFLEIRTHSFGALSTCVKNAAENEWESVEKVYQSAIDLHAAFYDVLNYENDSQQLERLSEEELQYLYDSDVADFYGLVMDNMYYNDMSVEDTIHHLEESLSQRKLEKINGWPKEEMAEVKASFTRMETVTDNIYKAILAQIEEARGNVKPAQYQLCLFSDSTGNNTETERIIYQFDTPKQNVSMKISLNYQYPVTTSNGTTTNYTMEVYDSIYGGYQRDYGLDEPTYFFTRVEDNVHFTLDAVGESGLPVDSQNDETLHEHKYIERIITVPTCTTNGYTTYKCSCGDSYKADETFATGHSWGRWENTKEPTYETEGEETRVCSNCNMGETRLTEKLPPYVPPQERLQNAQVGEYVAYGRYEQDNNLTNGTEEIEWLVLAKEEDRILLVSRYGVDVQPYHTEDTEITWENCSLRDWMNSTFFNAAFNEEEMQYIMTTTIENSGNEDWGSHGGNNTSDKIFALSQEEVEQYFLAAGLSAIAEKTLYVKQGNEGLTSECEWWLRTAGAFNTYAMTVSAKGNVGSMGLNVGVDYVAVRPAIWVSPE